MAKLDLSTLPRASCVFLTRHGMICSVSRKFDPNAVGMPGGKVDEGETDAQAAARECFEETGIVVSGLRPLYVAEDGFGFWCATFVPDQFVGEPRDMGQGLVRWITPEMFVKGHFASYNKAVLLAHAGLVNR